MRPTKPLTLPQRRHAALLTAVQAFLQEHFDEEVGELRAGLVLDFVLEQAGPSFYNLGVRDSQALLQDRLLDLEADLQRPEPDLR
ncbi:MAG: DUF2164 domain-containing protein [Acidobacteriota bacterium]